MAGKKRGSKTAGLKDFLAKEGFSAAEITAKDADRPRRVLSSGNDALDAATGIGGFPEGTFCILHGVESGGKTTLALQAVAETQRTGGIGVYLDFERKLDLRYAAALGVDLDAFVLWPKPLDPEEREAWEKARKEAKDRAKGTGKSPEAKSGPGAPPSIERGFAFMEACILRARKLDPDCPVLFVWDSLHAATCLKGYAKGYEDGEFPGEAQAYSRNLRRFVQTLADTRSTLLAISQVRMKIDPTNPRESKEKIAIGRAAMFYAILVFQIRNIRARGSVKKGATGETIEAIARKNQVAIPWQVATFPLVYGKGVDRGAATFYAAKALDLLTPKRKKKDDSDGGFYLDLPGWDERIILESPETLSELAIEDPDRYERIREGVRSQIGIRSAELVGPLSEEELEAEEAAAELAAKREGKGPAAVATEGEAPPEGA